jgi:uncharacterized membrane protein
MWDRLEEVLPENSSHRLLTAYGLAIVGILAVGDGLNLIYFPTVTLGLPDSTFANTLIALGGVLVFVTAYRIAMTTVEQGETTLEDVVKNDAVDAAEDGDYQILPSDDGPVQILKKRYARGEVSDEEFRRKLERLEESESVDFDSSDRETLIEESDLANSGLTDRQTAIE